MEDKMFPDKSGIFRGSRDTNTGCKKFKYFRFLSALRA